MEQLKPSSLVITHCGIHSRTQWHKLRVEGHPVFGIGTLKPVAGLGLADPNAQVVSGFLVRREDAEGLFWFVGALLPPSTAVAKQALSALAAEAMEHNSAITREVASSPVADGPSSSELRWFDRELARTKTMRSAGLDPQVGMRFLVQYLGESRASLSRKFGKELAAPTKRGKRNFWLLSQVDAYVGGRHLSR